MRGPNAAIAASALLLLLSAPASSAIADLSGNDPHWIKDTASNCWAANPDPSPGESIAWMGACEDGLVSGAGTLAWYLNGKLVGRDEGTFKNGELMGHGRISLSDGANFEGDFPGKGVLTLPNGQKVDAESIKEVAGWSIEQSQPQR